jgi:transposase
MKISNFLGIDVSKDTLDIAILRGGNLIKQLKIKNQVKEIKRTFILLRKEGFLEEETLCCLEHTGIYNNLLLSFFHKSGYMVCVESARQIKLSMGMVRGKSDKIDAVRIAQYAHRNCENLKYWAPKRDVLEKLKSLLRNRARLLKIKNQLSVSIKESKKFVMKEIYDFSKKVNRKTLEEANKAIQIIDQEMLKLIKSDSSLVKQYNLAKSVDGVGPVIATTVIVKTNEFKDFQDPRKFACQAGVVPFEHSSGKSIRGRTKVSHMADKAMKTLFHLAAMAVIKKGEFKQYYDRKIKEGKNKMLVINAVRNKIIRRIFAVVKRGIPYQKFNNLVLIEP